MLLHCKNGENYVTIYKVALKVNTGQMWQKEDGFYEK